MKLLRPPATVPWATILACDHVQARIVLTKHGVKDDFTLL
jgi:hypothetical protein